MHTQNWYPATCKCVVEQFKTDEMKQHEFRRVIQKCAFHESISDDELYSVIKEENVVYCGVARILTGYDEIDLKLAEEKVGPNGTYVDFKEGISCDLSFTGEGKARELGISVQGAQLSKTQKESIRELCAERFGSGKVSL